MSAPSLAQLKPEDTDIVKLDIRRLCFDIHEIEARQCHGLYRGVNHAPQDRFDATFDLISLGIDFAVPDHVELFRPGDVPGRPRQSPCPLRSWDPPRRHGRRSARTRCRRRASRRTAIDLDIDVDRRKQARDRGGCQHDLAEQRRIGSLLAAIGPMFHSTNSWLSRFVVPMIRRRLAACASATFFRKASSTYVSRMPALARCPEARPSPSTAKRPWI